MNPQAMTGAVNPYALAELAIGRKIDWRRVENPIELVARTLETSAENLFDGDRGSPILALQHEFRTQRPSHGEDEVPHPRPERLELASGISRVLQNRLEKVLLPAYILGETEYDGATWTDIGDFFEEGTEFADPVQGALGDCWLIAALASVAWSRPYAILQRNRTIGPGNDQFVNAIDLKYKPGDVRTYEVTDKIPVLNFSSMPMYGRSAEAGEIWPGVYEKAFAKLRTGNLSDKPDFRSLNGGDPVDACARLVPGLTATYTETRTTSADVLWQKLTANCVANPGNGHPLLLSRAGRTASPITAWTYYKASDAPDTIAYDAASGIVACHAYSVLGWIGTRTVARPLGQRNRYIVLRNPWGMHEGNVETLDGSWNAYDRSWMRSTPLDAGGVFAMTIEAFKTYFAGMGVAA